jgi:predicted RNA-binding Zn ribbon-like protein
MNILNALDRVRDRLIENDARPETLKLVDAIAKTASTPGADRAQVRSITDLVRRLMRTPVANQNVGVYDDLAVLEEQLETQTADFAAQKAEEEAKPMPKPRKYYKQLKEKEKEEEQKQQHSDRESRAS